MSSFPFRSPIEVLSATNSCGIPRVTHVFSNLFESEKGSVIGKFQLSFGGKGAAVGKRNHLFYAKKFEFNCSRGVSTMALVDDVAECLDEMEVTEPSVSTMLMNFENNFDPYDALSTPLYQTATFKQPRALEFGSYDYTRSGNPTRDVLERLLAKLDGADRAFCFTSGMAALAAVTHLVCSGEEVVAGDDLYGGSDRLLSQVIPKTGVVVKRVDTTNLDEVASAIGPRTKLVWVESPTNPRQQISDICVESSASLLGFNFRLWLILLGLLVFYSNAMVVEELPEAVLPPGKSSNSHQLWETIPSS